MLGSWSEHVDELLYDGERVQRRVDLEAATVVVTNDRVLVLTEDGSGSNYRRVTRPNVARVSIETESALGQLLWATVVLFLGVGLLVVATTYQLAAAVNRFAGDDATGVTSSALETAETLLTAFDLTILAGGVLLMVVAAVFFARYIRSRSRRLLIRVTDDDDIALPVTDADLEAGRPAALEAAIGPGPMPEGVGTAIDSETMADSDESG